MQWNEKKRQKAEERSESNVWKAAENLKTDEKSMQLYEAKKAKPVWPQLFSRRNQWKQWKLSTVKTEMRKAARKYHHGNWKQRKHEKRNRRMAGVAMPATEEKPAGRSASAWLKSWRKRGSQRQSRKRGNNRRNGQAPWKLLSEKKIICESAGKQKRKQQRKQRQPATMASAGKHRKRKPCRSESVTVSTKAASAYRKPGGSEAASAISQPSAASVAGWPKASQLQTAASAADSLAGNREKQPLKAIAARRKPGEKRRLSVAAAAAKSESRSGNQRTKIEEAAIAISEAWNHGENDISW